MTAMAKKKLILLNAPPRAGKDTAAEFISAATGARHMKLSATLKNRTHALYDLGDIPADHFEDVKDQPREEFMGISPRAAYIAVAEKLMKPLYGVAIFAQFLIDELESVDSDIIVVSDLGFQEELDLFIQHSELFKDIFVIQIEREGCDFSSDSRGWVQPKGVDFFTQIENNGTLEQLELETLSPVCDWLNTSEVEGVILSPSHVKVKG